MVRKRLKKKKGFTLIELVIVLAVLAIIALIAIPNFTKVRNDSLKKADKQTVEQIEKITLMAIADQDIKIDVVKSGTITIKVKDNGTIECEVKGDVSFATTKDDGKDGEGNYKGMLKEISRPQQNTGTAYIMTIKDNGIVEGDVVGASLSN